MTVEGGFSFREWYADNGEELNRSRRARYDNDPEYRAQVLRLNRASRQRARKRREEERRQALAAVEAPGRPRAYKTVEVSMGEGEPPVKLFTIGAVAKALGCSVQQVRLWEKRGVIHPAELRSDCGDRLYTGHEVDEMRQRLLDNGLMEAQADARLFQGGQPKHFVRLVRFADGTERRVALFRVGSLARALKRSVLTVEQMEQRGALPSTPFRASRTRYRLYTVGMIAAVAEAYLSRGGAIRGRERWAEFTAEVKAAWEALGVFGAELADEPRAGRKTGVS